jgi:hypothetical protein
MPADLHMEALRALTEALDLADEATRVPEADDERHRAIRDRVQEIRFEASARESAADLARLRSLADQPEPPGVSEPATWCPQCGPRVAVDEDGCCASCGADATGDGADRAGAALAELDRIRRELTSLGKRLEDTFMGGHSSPRDLEIFRHGMGAAATCVEAVLRGERNQAPLLQPEPAAAPREPRGGETRDILAAEALVMVPTRAGALCRAAIKWREWARKLERTAPEDEDCELIEAVDEFLGARPA